MLKQVLAVVAITAATLVAADAKKDAAVTTTSIEVAPEKLEIAAPTVAVADKDAKATPAAADKDAKTPATDAVAAPATTTEKK